MPNFTLQDIYNELDVFCADSSTGYFPRNSTVTFVNEGLRRAKRIVVEFPSREFVSQAAVMSGIYRYAAPTGMEDMIGIFDQVRVPDRLGFSRKDPSVFKRDFPGNENVYAIGRNKTTKILLINLKTLELSTPVVHQMSSVTGNGTWGAVAGTDATNLDTDTLHFPDDKTGIKFDIDVDASVTDTVGIVNSTMTAVDLSGDSVQKSGKMTMEFYWPSVTMPTSVRLRFGSSDTAYYEITVTTQIDGTAFVQGLNQLGFDWQDVTPTGSPDDVAVDYVQLLVTFPATIVADVLGVAFSNIVMREKMFVDVHYLSDYLVMDNDGTTLKSSFDDQNDTSSYLLVDETFWDWIVYHTAEQLFSFYEPDADKLKRVSALRVEAEEALALKSPSRREPAQQTWIDTDDLQPDMN